MTTRRRLEALSRCADGLSRAHAIVDPAAIRQAFPAFAATLTPDAYSTVAGTLVFDANGPNVDVVAEGGLRIGSIDQAAVSEYGRFASTTIEAGFIPRVTLAVRAGHAQAVVARATVARTEPNYSVALELAPIGVAVVVAASLVLIGALALLISGIPGRSIWLGVTFVASAILAVLLLVHHYTKRLQRVMDRRRAKPAPPASGEGCADEPQV